MPASKLICPICNEKISGSPESCPRCGFKFIGATHEFDAVVVPAEGDVQAARCPSPELKVASGPYAGESFVLHDGTFTIGRDPKCDIFLSNMTVSRHNSTITIDGCNARVVDAGSTNGTWVNGYIVDEAELKSGDHVQIGTFDMIFNCVE